MLISNISVNNDDKSFETPIKKSSVTAPGDHILLGFGDAWSFEIPRINNHIVTAPSTLIVLGDGSAESFENPQKTITMSMYQVPIFF